MIHQCTRCELRFHDRSEVRDHLVADHGLDPEQLDVHYRMPAGVRPHRDAPQPAREHSEP